MSLPMALAGSSPALLMITNSQKEQASPQFDDQTSPDRGGEDSESVFELLQHHEMELMKIQMLSADHQRLLQLCPDSAGYSRVIINKDVVSACNSDVDLKLFIESHHQFVVGKVHDNSSSNSICTLSIRTMSGEIIKASFRADESLLDVKRRLHHEHNISFKTEEDDVASRYTTIGHFKPSRFAFFSPATRTTFTESQELMRLKDLGLCPRSALLLRPDFDERAMKAARAAESQSNLRAFWIKSKSLLQAIYQFFDYGVDEAQLEFQDMVEEIENEDAFRHSIFGAFAAPVPAMTSVAPPTSVIDTRDESVKVNEKDAMKAQSVDAKDSTAEVYGEEAKFNI